MDGTIGEIKVWGGQTSRIPKGWALCQGQTITIQTNPALFSIIGAIYGGDGSTNFQLPNMQGRFPVGVGSISLNNVSMNYVLGNKGGALVNTVNITSQNLPVHTHPIAIPALFVSGTATGNITPKCCNDGGDKNSPKGNASAGINNGYVAIGDATDSMAAMPASLSVTGNTTAGNIVSGGGGGQAGPSPITIPVLPAFFAVNWIICIEGYYPVFD